eukprot:6939536-Pyramimonas_sp.AAC.1
MDPMTCQPCCLPPFCHPLRPRHTRAWTDPFSVCSYPLSVRVGPSGGGVGGAGGAGGAAEVTRHRGGWEGAGLCVRRGGQRGVYQSECRSLIGPSEGCRSLIGPSEGCRSLIGPSEGCRSLIGPSE